MFNIKKDKKEQRNVEGSLSEYPFLMSIKPKEAYIFRSNSYECGGYHHSILSYFHVDGAIDDYKLFWGIDMIPTGLDESVVVTHVQTVERMTDGWIKEHQTQAENEYLNTMKEMSADVAAQLAEYREELALLETAIADKQAIVSAAVAASKRAAEMEDQKNFYRLNLSDEDKAEIERLREVLPYLRDSEPLNKVIWKVYYEKPYTDMIGRVVGTGVHTGIYKITNIENNMCYVGQAANIADRWKQHIKRGVGAETPTRNKLYPAMASFGVENFTFEIVEECDRNMLNDREDYWQEYFHAKDFGYSIK